MEFKKPDFLQKSKQNKTDVTPLTASEENEELEQLDIKNMFYRFAPIDDTVDIEYEISGEDNMIVGEKTGTTMNAEVSMERAGDNDGTVTKDEKNLPEYRSAETEEEPPEPTEPEEPSENDEEIVNFTTRDNSMFEAPVEIEENLQLGSQSVNGTVAEDIIDSVPQFDIKPIIITDIETIDVDIPDAPDPDSEDVTIAMVDEEFDEKKFQKESLDAIIEKENLPPLPKKDEEPDGLKYEKLFGKNDPVPKGTNQVSRVPVYTPDNRVEKLNVNVGKFSVVVRQEYEEYLKSKNPEISATYHPVESVVTEEVRTVRNLKKSFISGFMEFFSANPDGEKFEKQTTAEKVVTVDDYDDREDARNVAHEIGDNLRKLRFRSLALLLLTAITMFMVFVQSVVPHSVSVSNGVTPVVFAGLNLLFIIAGSAISGVTILNGLNVLKKFKGNSDTAVAVASISSIIAGVTALFANSEFFNGTYSYYTVIVLLGLLCNSFGKLIMVRRVDKNFRFIVNNKKLKSAKIYTDETIAAKMMSGTVVEKPIIAYQHKTDFLSNFLQLSYAPDPSEEAAGKLAPFTTVCSIVVAVIFGIISKSVVGGIAAFSLITAISMPICSIMAVNVPMKNFCRKLLKKGAMLSGFQGVKQFCDTTAIMVDADELYPEGSVVLNGIKAFNEQRLDSACLAAAAVLKEVKSPLAPVFDRAMQESRSVLPDVESVMYEDQLGLVGWVNGERILVGNRDLMKKYSIEIPEIDFEDTYRRQHKQITFLALGGLLTAMMVTTYRPNVEIATELQRAEANGISLLVSTSDCNITSEQISEDFGVFYRSVKVLPTGLGNVCKEVTSTFTERSRAYLATRGRFTQLARALSGCVQLKANISIAVLIQLIGVVLGILVMATIMLYSGMNILRTMPILIYSVLWGAASMVVPLIKKP